MRDIKKEIQTLKDRLYHLMNSESNKLNSRDIIRLSQELDILIKEYYVA